MIIRSQDLNIIQPGSLSFVFSIEEEGSRGFGVSVDCGLELIMELEKNLNSKKTQKLKLTDSNISEMAPAVFYNNQKVKIEPLEMAFKWLNLNNYKIPFSEIYFKSKVQLGSGFGMSSATTNLFLKLFFKSLDSYSDKTKISNQNFKPKIPNSKEIANLVYYFEKESGTGLGDVVYQQNLGFQLRELPSSSFQSKTLPIKNQKLYYKIFGPKSSSKILKSLTFKTSVNKAYKTFLDSKFTEKNNLDLWLEESWKFSLNSGLPSKNIINQIEDLNTKNIKGSMIMIGDGIISSKKFADCETIEVCNTILF